MGLENSFDTMAGSGGGHLSGGEKQRISIARAMMKDAPIIILDEATANVDPENEKELMDAIRELTQEKTVIMIAHRLKTVRRTSFMILRRLYRCITTNSASHPAASTDVTINTGYAPNRPPAAMGRKLSTMIVSCTSSAWHVACAISSQVCVRGSNSAGS